MENAFRVISSELKLAASILTSDHSRVRGRIGEDVEISSEFQEIFDKFNVSDHYGLPDKIVCVDADLSSGCCAIISQNGLVKVFLISLGEILLDYKFLDDTESHLPLFMKLRSSDQLIVVSSRGKLWVWDINTKSNIGCLSLPDMKGVYVNSFSLANGAAEGFAFLGMSDSSVRVIEFFPNVNQSNYSISADQVELDSVDIGPVVAIECNPNDFSYVLIGYMYGEIILWDWDKRVKRMMCKAKLLCGSTTGLIELKCLSWHPKGYSFVAGYSDGSYAYFSTKNTSATLKKIEANCNLAHPIISFQWLQAMYNGSKTLILAVAGGTDMEETVGITFMSVPNDPNRTSSKIQPHRHLQNDSELKKLTFLPIGKRNQKLVFSSVDVGDEEQDESTSQINSTFNTVSLLESDTIGAYRDSIIDQLTSASSAAKSDLLLDQIFDIQKFQQLSNGEMESIVSTTPSTFQVDKSITCLSFHSHVKPYQSAMIRHYLQLVEMKHISKGADKLKLSYREIPITRLIALGHKDGSVSLWNMMGNCDSYDSMELLCDMPILQWLEHDICMKSLPEDIMFDDVYVTKIDILFDSTDSCHIGIGFSNGIVAILVLGSNSSSCCLTLIPLSPENSLYPKNPQFKKSDSLIETSDPIISTVILGHLSSINSIKLFSSDTSKLFLAASDDSGMVSMCNVSDAVGSLLPSMKNPCHTVFEFWVDGGQNVVLFAVQPWKLFSYDCSLYALKYSLPLNLEFEWGMRIDPSNLFLTNELGDPLSAIDSDSNDHDDTVHFIICCPSRVAFIKVLNASNTKKNELSLQTVAMNVINLQQYKSTERKIFAEAGLCPLPEEFSIGQPSNTYLCVVNHRGQGCNFLLPSLTRLPESKNENITIQEGGVAFSANGEIVFHSEQVALARVTRFEQRNRNAPDRYAEQNDQGSLKEKIKAKIRLQSKLQKLFSTSNQYDTLSTDNSPLSSPGDKSKQEKASQQKESLFKGKKRGEKKNDAVGRKDQMVMNEVSEAVRLAKLRGDKLNTVDDNADQLKHEAMNFAMLAEQINQNMDAKQEECSVS